MNQLVQVDLTLNAYLFGSLLLLLLWFLTLLSLRLTGRRHQIPELWWASLACAWLAVSEPLFVPEYWHPPSIMRVGRWDLESFLFCFAVGGISSVLAEIPPLKAFFVRLYFVFESGARSVLSGISSLTAGRLHATILDRAPVSGLVPRDHVRIENMLLVTFFIGTFGATSHFGLNIIYDVAAVCIATAVFIAWRRPSLRWQILGGGISFTLLYTIVLVITGYFYPDFYAHWNHDELSGMKFLGAPAEEYLFSFTFGILWAPLYEAWKQARP